MPERIQKCEHANVSGEGICQDCVRPVRYLPATPQQPTQRRMCANCADEVEVGLSSREWCDGCEEEAERNAEEAMP